MGLEAVVTTCRICSSADKPPPTWKATWSALFWKREIGTREKQWETWRGEQTQVSHCFGIGGILSLPTSWFLEGSWSEIWSKVIPKEFLLNLKSAQPFPAPPQQPKTNARQQTRISAHKAGVVWFDKEELREYIEWVKFRLDKKPFTSQIHNWANSMHESMTKTVEKKRKKNLFKIHAQSS